MRRLCQAVAKVNSHPVNRARNKRLRPTHVLVRRVPVDFGPECETGDGDKHERERDATTVQNEGEGWFFLSLIIWRSLSGGVSTCCTCNFLRLAGCGIDIRSGGGRGRPEKRKIHPEWSHEWRFNSSIVPANEISTVLAWAVGYVGSALNSRFSTGTNNSCLFTHKISVFGK